MRFCMCYAAYGRSPIRHLPTDICRPTFADFDIHWLDKLQFCYMPISLLPIRHFPILIFPNSVICRYRHLPIVIFTYQTIADLIFAGCDNFRSDIPRLFPDIDWSWHLPTNIGKGKTERHLQTMTFADWHITHWVGRLFVFQTFADQTFADKYATEMNF